MDYAIGDGSGTGSFTNPKGNTHEMAITYDAIMGYEVPDVTQTLSDADCILYALGVGFGTQPVHPGHLRHVYEEGLEVLPMMANVVAYPGFWLKDPATGVDWKRVLHGEQVFTIHRPLPVGVKLRGKTRIVGVDDKGAAFGAFMFARRDVVEEATDEPVCTLEQTTLLRGDGGCGGRDGRPRPVHRLPRHDPDLHHDLAVAPEAALVYRLSGDRNPLHVDPAVAKAAGFERPILHGMCTMGYAGHAVMAAVCDYDGSRIRTMQVRFTAPAYPGETLRTEMWIDGGIVSFRTRALERDTVVLGNGRVELAAADSG